MSSTLSSATPGTMAEMGRTDTVDIPESHTAPEDEPLAPDMRTTSARPLAAAPAPRPTRDRSASSAAARARLTFAHHSVSSDLHPERNEDAFFIDQRRGLAGVFDGVGGSVAGEVAAGLAARLTRLGWKRFFDRMSDEARQDNQPSPAPTDIGALLADLLQRAHEAICALTLPDAPDDERRDSGAEGAATTAAIAAVHRLPDKRGQHVTCAWVGDSRVYLLRGRGHLLRLTQDDGLLTRLVEDGVVTEHDAFRVDQAISPDQLTDLGLSLFNRRNGITQSLGGPRTPEIHATQTPLRAGDRLLLCTDGIHDNLTDAELELLLRVGARTTVAETIVASARLRSRDDGILSMRAKPDDMTAVVITSERRTGRTPC